MPSPAVRHIGIGVAAPTQQAGCIRLKTDQLGTVVQIRDYTALFSVLQTSFGPIYIQGKDSGAVGRYVKFIYDEVSDGVFQQYIILTEWTGTFQTSEDLFRDFVNPPVDPTRGDILIDTDDTEAQVQVDCASGNPILPPGSGGPSLVNRKHIDDIFIPEGKGSGDLIEITAPASRANIKGPSTTSQPHDVQNPLLGYVHDTDEIAGTEYALMTFDTPTYVLLPGMVIENVATGDDVSVANPIGTHNNVPLGTPSSEWL